MINADTLGGKPKQGQTPIYGQRHGRTLSATTYEANMVQTCMIHGGPAQKSPNTRPSTHMHSGFMGYAQTSPIAHKWRGDFGAFIRVNYPDLLAEPIIDYLKYHNAKCLQICHNLKQQVINENMLLADKICTKLRDSRKGFPSALKKRKPNDGLLSGPESGSEAEASRHNDVNLCPDRTTRPRRTPPSLRTGLHTPAPQLKEKNKLTDGKTPHKDGEQDANSNVIQTS
uniref:Uncharacterized protein n=1 Tax=Oryza glumipatula TaxID=40148 RepID=A0A0E0AUU2_9ORYZ